MSGRWRTPGAVVLVLLASFLCTYAGATFGLRRPSTSQLRTETASSLRADYSADPHGALQPPLLPDVVQAAAQDLAALAATPTIAARPFASATPGPGGGTPGAPQPTADAGSTPGARHSATPRAEPTHRATATPRPGTSATPAPAGTATPTARPKDTPTSVTKDTPTPTPKPDVSAPTPTPTRPSTAPTPTPTSKKGPSATNTPKVPTPVPPTPTPTPCLLGLPPILGICL